MENLKVLYISQEIHPFLDENEIASKVRHLPQKISEKGNEIRVFMPRFGCINERRHQLHEVIRLSGMNLVIDDEDHPLIIKVASIPQARMQVYFIDNDEYFRRKNVFTNKAGKFHEDNDERALFFCKGALETVKKLGWKPDVIHCHGWMTAMVPMLVKKMFHDDPHFENSKLIYSIYNSGFEDTLSKDLVSKIEFDGIAGADVEVLNEPSTQALHKIALQYADAVVKGSAELDEADEAIVTEAGLPTLEYCGVDNYADAYHEFYQTVFTEESALV